MADKYPDDLYISFYRYSTYKRCPAILGYWDTVPSEDRIEDNRNAVVGSVIHELAEMYLKSETTLEKIYGIANLVFNKYVEENFVKWRGRSDRSLVRSKVGIHLAALETLLIKHDISPENCQAEVPHKVEITIDGEVLKLAGRIDVIQTLADVWIFDFKATENEFYLDIEQMYVYFFIADEVGPAPKGGSFLLTHYEKDVPVQRDPYIEEALRYNLLRTAKLIRDKNFPQTPGRPCGWCEFANVCAGAKRWKQIKKKMDEQKEDQTTGRIPW